MNTYPIDFKQSRTNKWIAIEIFEMKHLKLNLKVIVLRFYQTANKTHKKNPDFFQIDDICKENIL